MPERLITHLRHVALAVPDYDRQYEFFATMWGLSEVADGAAPVSLPGARRRPRGRPPVR